MFEPVGIVCIDVLAEAALVLAVSRADEGAPVNLDIYVLTPDKAGERTFTN